MAVFRERPYSQFNFSVDVGTGDTTSPRGGFQEVSGLGIEVTVAEYRAGNSKVNTPIKITGLHKVPDVTLKRGLMGSLDLYSWLDDVRNGNESAMRTVIIELLSEDHTAPVQRWKLTNARPIKYTGPALTGKGTDVAIEELVLASENIDIA